MAARWDGPGLEAWDAWTPHEAARRLAAAGLNVPWAVVGGWSVDLFLGRQTRRHGDLEIAVCRADFPAVRAALAGFAIHVVGDGQVRALGAGEEPPADRHQNWVLDEAAQAWRLDVMLEPGDHDTWVFRRDDRIRAPRLLMTGATPEGIPFLLPHGALLFKAKTRGAKDEADFRACLPRLHEPHREWLAAALGRVHPSHPWIARLQLRQGGESA